MKKNIVFLFFIVFISFLVIPLRANAEIIGKVDTYEEAYEDYKKHLDFSVKNGALIQCYYDETDSVTTSFLNIYNVVRSEDDKGIATFAITYDPLTSEYTFSSRVIYNLSTSATGTFISSVASLPGGILGGFLSQGFMKLVEDSGKGLAVNSLKNVTISYEDVKNEKIFAYDKNSKVSDENDVDHYYYYLYLSKEAKDSLSKGECPKEVKFTGEYFTDDYGKIRFCFQNGDNDDHACSKDAAWATEILERSYGGKVTYSKYSGDKTTINKANSILSGNATKLSKIKNPSVTKSACKKYANGGSLKSSFKELDDSLKLWKSTWNNSFKNNPGNISFNDNFLGSNYEKLLKGAAIAGNSYINACSKTGLSKNQIAEMRHRLGSDVYTTAFAMGDGLTGNAFDYLPEGCKNIRESKLGKWLDYAFTAIKIATPILCIILIGKDIASAVTSQKDENFKTVRNNIIKRLIIGLVIYMLPTIVTTVLNLAGLEGGTCGIK